MKKFFTLIIGLMTALSSGAQGFEFQYQGQSLADGETVIIAAEEDIFGELSCETNSMMNPADGLVMKLLSSATATASATLQINHNSLEAGALQWCMGGDCTTLRDQTSLTKNFTVNGSEQVQFDATNITSEGYLLATLTVTVGLETHKVNIKFVNGDIDGIGKLQAEHGSVCYDLRGRLIQGHPTPGIYVVNDGAHFRKVAIR